MNQTVHNFTQQSNFVQTIIRVISKDMIRTQQYLISTIYVNMNDSVVLQKGHVAEFMEKYYFVGTKIRENIVETYSIFTH